MDVGVYTPVELCHWNMKTVLPLSECETKCEVMCMSYRSRNLFCHSEETKDSAYEASRHKKQCQKYSNVMCAWSLHIAAARWHTGFARGLLLMGICFETLSGTACRGFMQILT